MKENYLFIKRFFSNPSTIGSIFPSSKKLADSLVKKTSLHHQQPLRYLEVGAGIGVLTQHILPNMRKNDHLDIVEIDAEFCALLRKKYAYLPNIMIHEMSFLDFDSSDYDVIISSLPLNSFNSQVVNKIFLKFKSLVKKDGYLSYFEYRGLGKIKQTCLFGNSLIDFEHALALRHGFIYAHCEEIETVWGNLLPARIFHCKM